MWPDQIHNTPPSTTTTPRMPLQRMPPSKLIYIRNDCNIPVIRNNPSVRWCNRNILETQHARRDKRLLLH